MQRLSGTESLCNNRNYCFHLRTLHTGTSGTTARTKAGRIILPVPLFRTNKIISKSEFQDLVIPDICHLDHLHVGGEEICHVEKFQISIHGISPHEEEFQFFHTTDVEKCEFLPNLVKFHISPQDRCEKI